MSGDYGLIRFMDHTSVDNLVGVEEVDGVKDLLDSLGGILLSELALLANPVKELTTGGELGYDVELVLG